MSIVELCFIFVFAVAPNAAKVVPLLEDDSVSIVGGDEVDIKEYPYQALLLFDGRRHCGGSIISDEYILTAAHCVFEVEPNQLTVRIGSSYVGEGGQIYNVSQIFLHPIYNIYRHDYDVAVLKTMKLTIDNITTKIVKIADSGSNLSEGHNIVVTGWGRIKENGPMSKVLRAVTVPVISLEHCQEMYNKTKLTDRMLCAGFDTGGKDACTGDSGGPAVDTESLVQYGIVSWGKGCARKDFPGVYTYIPAVRGWIKQVTGF